MNERPRLALALRLATVAALGLALASPVVRSERAPAATVFVVDVSRSRSDDDLARARAYVERARASADATDLLSLVTFAREARLVPLDPGAPAAIVRHDDGSASDIEGALTLALAALPSDAAPQIVLLTDGLETHGSLRDAARMLKSRDVPVWAVHDEPIEPSEVAVTTLTVPSGVRAGERFSVEAELLATAPRKVEVRLTIDGRDVPLAPARTLMLAPGRAALRFEAEAEHSGRSQLRLALTPEQPDRFPENDAITRTLHVSGPPRVLYVEREPAHARIVVAGLERAGFSVDLREPSAAPDQLAALAGYDFYVLSDVPYEALRGAREHALVAWIEQGGAFMMAGGERAFGPGGYAGTPLASRLPVRLDAPLTAREPGVALMLVLDKSGSMTGDKLERAKEAAIASAALLGPRDALGVIGFDAEPVRVVRLARAPRADAIARDVGRLAPGGGTALFAALDAAYADLSGVEARVKHVVVLTDGRTDEGALAPLARSMHADGITISTVGLGDDVQRALLTRLADEAGGRAYFTRDPARIPRLFSDETERVAHASVIERRVSVRRVAAAAFLRGIVLERAPPLAGYVETRARGLPAELVLASDRGDPLLARMRVGLGWSLAFTSDLKPRWAAAWLAWPGFSQLLAQIVREHVRRSADEVIAIATRLEGETLHAEIEVRDEHAHFVNGLTGTLQIARADASPEQTTRSVPIAQTAPGRYEAHVSDLAPGDHALSARLVGPDTEAPPRSARGQALHPYVAEARPPFASDPTLLATVTARTGGGLVAASAALPPRPVRPGPARSLVGEAVAIALLLFLLEVWLRRLGPRSAPTGPTGT